MPNSSNSLMSSIRSASDVIHKMKQNNSTKEEMLLFLVGLANQISGSRSTASILLLDENGLLRNGASPGLPKDYLAAIDKIKPHRNLGTCASAAATGQVVVTTDFLADDKWAELRQLPIGIGFRSAWSMPIKSYDDTVLGTFGTYFRDCRRPTPEEQTAIQILALAATIAIS